MAQSKSNTVTWGINAKSSFPAPKFDTKTTTPKTNNVSNTYAGLAFPALSALGVKPSSSSVLSTAQKPATGATSAVNTRTATSGVFPNPSAGTISRNDMASQVSNTTQKDDIIKTNSSSTKSNQKTSVKPPEPVPSNSFRGILDSLLGASRPTREQERARKEMERISAQNKAIGDNAAKISAQYGDEIARVGQLGAGAVAGNLSTGTNVVGSGNAAIASQSASARMQALAEAQKAALQGTAQQLTGNEQAATAFRPSLEAALTQQQLQQQGLGTAAGFAAPVAVPFSSGLYSPTGEGQVAGGFAGYGNYANAEQVRSLMSQFPDAGIQYNPNMTPEQNLQSALQAVTGGSAIYQGQTFGVPGQTSVVGAQVAKTAQAGYNESFQLANQIQTQKNYADNIANQLLNTMSQYGINTSDARKINEIINFLGRQFGYEAQSAFQTALAEAQRAYSSLLTIGGGTVPTEATAAANKILDPNATVGQIATAIEQLKMAGEQRLNAQKAQANIYLQQLQGASTTQRGGGSTGVTIPPGNYTWENIPL